MTILGCEMGKPTILGNTHIIITEKNQLFSTIFGLQELQISPLRDPIWAV